MVLMEIAGVRILYTGDYSCEEDRHLMAAEVPTAYPPDVLIVEATYGMQVRGEFAVCGWPSSAAPLVVLLHGKR